MTRGRAYAIVVALCAIPRVGVLLHEKDAILGSFVEKSDVLARVFLSSGTFGYVPGKPTAYTQPLYGWFLIAVYWIAGRHWWSLGTAQILVACGTGLLVFEAGRRFLSARTALIGAAIATLQPYLIWHDVHANREILDQPLGAAMFLLTLLVASRRSWRLAALLGLVIGIAILSNSRLVLFPFVLGGYLLWRKAGWAAAVALPVLAAVALSPWVVRNKIELGCYAITTDARALWKANNLETYTTLKAGKWIDDVPDLAGAPVNPQIAAERGLPIDECAFAAYYRHQVFQFWEHRPGAKAKLAVQATEMLWDPRVGLEAARSGERSVDTLRSWIQPLYSIPLYLLAIAGLFVVAPAFRVLAAIFIAYETAAAWVFAGTTRYRVPWDFALALLAAAAIERLPWSRLPFRRLSSQ